MHQEMPKSKMSVFAWILYIKDVITLVLVKLINCCYLVFPV